jgi:hypothetical protein
MTNKLSTRVATHRITLKDKRELDITQAIHTKLYPVFMNKEVKWAVPIDVGGTCFNSGDMKYLDSYENIMKRENKGRGTGEAYNNVTEELKKLADVPKKDDKELSEIDKMQREIKAVIALDDGNPYPTVGFKVDNNMSGDERKRRKIQNEEEQEEALIKWEERKKSSALKVKHLFVNPNKYWFFQEEGHHREGFLEEFPVVERANVGGDKEEEGVSIDEVNNLF